VKTGFAGINADEMGFQAAFRWNNQAAFRHKLQKMKQVHAKAGEEVRK